MEPDLSPAACDKTVRGRFGNYPWPCVRALDHDGDCEPPVAARHYVEPLEYRATDWLISEVGMLLGRIESMERERQADRTAARHQSLIGRLIRIAPANGKRKTVPAEDVRAAWQAAINGE